MLCILPGSRSMRSSGSHTKPPGAGSVCNNSRFLGYVLSAVRGSCSGIPAGSRGLPCKLGSIFDRTVCDSQCLPFHVSQPLRFLCSRCRSPLELNYVSMRIIQSRRQLRFMRCLYREFLGCPPAPVRHVCSAGLCILGFLSAYSELDRVQNRLLRREIVANGNGHCFCFC